MAQKLWNDTQRIKATMPSKFLLIKSMRYIQTFKKQSLKNVFQIYFLSYSRFILSPELSVIVVICRFMAVNQKINPLNCFVCYDGILNFKTENSAFKKIISEHLKSIF